MEGVSVWDRYLSLSLWTEWQNDKTLPSLPVGNGYFTLCTTVTFARPSELSPFVYGWAEIRTTCLIFQDRLLFFLEFDIGSCLNQNSSSAMDQLKSFTSGESNTAGKWGANVELSYQKKTTFLESRLFINSQTRSLQLSHSISQGITAYIFMKQNATMWSSTLF